MEILTEFFSFFSGVTFFREKIYALLVEMDTNDFFDDKHFFATFLHPKHRDMSESTDLHYLFDGDDNLFLSCYSLESILTVKKFETLSRLRVVLLNMKPISNTNDMVDLGDQGERRKKIQIVK
jgi:hypothetical protein